MTQEQDRRIDETVTVTVGVLGRAEQATGSAHAFGTLTGTLREQSEQVGAILGAAYRRALIDAIQEYSPQMRNHFRDQANAESGPMSE